MCTYFLIAIGILFSSPRTFVGSIQVFGLHPCLLLLAWRDWKWILSVVGLDTRGMLTRNISSCVAWFLGKHTEDFLVNSVRSWTWQQWTSRKFQDRWEMMNNLRSNNPQKCKLNDFHLATSSHFFRYALPKNCMSIMGYGGCRKHYRDKMQIHWGKHNQTH